LSDYLNVAYKNMKRKALFLDRDGIINVDHGYVYKRDDFEFVEGIFDLVRLFADAGYLIFVVTNQSGIGRGYYSEEDFQKLTEWMLQAFKEQGIEIAQVQHCPHAPDARCSCRKPETGMIDAITACFPIDLSRSWMIGDKQSDIDLAKNAGIGHTVAIGDAPIDGAEYRFNTLQESRQTLRNILQNKRHL